MGKGWSKIPSTTMAVWLDALIEAAREHDPHFTDEVEADWRASLSGPIERMTSMGFQE